MTVDKIHDLLSYLNIAQNWWDSTGSLCNEKYFLVVKINGLN